MEQPPDNASPQAYPPEWMGTNNMITHFHAHIYYKDTNRDLANNLRTSIEENFIVEMGRWREQPVGPHPQPMYQVSFQPELF